MKLFVLSTSLCALSQVAFEDEARDNRVIVPRKDCLTPCKLKFTASYIQHCVSQAKSLQSSWMAYMIYSSYKPGLV